jgi:hypothetical protein
MLLAFGLIPSLVGCPVVPPASEWGPTDVGCLDHWSLAHYGSGVLLGQALGEDSFWPSMAVLAGWEVVEPSVWPTETSLNQWCDIATGGVGWLTTRSVRSEKPTGDRPAA